MDKFRKYLPIVVLLICLILPVNMILKVLVCSIMIFDIARPYMSQKNDDEVDKEEKK